MDRCTATVLDQQKAVLVELQALHEQAKTREKALAITKLEESIMWLERSA